MSSTAKHHHYSTRVRWTGNTGAGTSDYRAYERSHDITADGKPTIAGSSDPAFRGDASQYNPEELLVSSLSACHMLWYLHLCADAGVVVTDYSDEARGAMEETTSGGRFTLVILQPHVTVASPDMIEKASQLHTSAHTNCFIANSVNFEVRVEPEIVCI
jgi:organic hydroperoxide reductase OsmC/OhrA